MEQVLLFPVFDKECSDEPVNVASVPQRSPFRYPGGKTWLVPLFRRWMNSQRKRPELLVEPFAGGGIIGLTAAFEHLAEQVVMVELDDKVAAVWESLLGGEAEWLAERILTFDLSLRNIQQEVLRKPTSRKELAFQTLLRNRTAHGGILADGAGILKRGENGRGVASRWYPETISRRIRAIDSIKERIKFIHGDGIKTMEDFKNDSKAVFFIDPPYTAGGKRAGSRLYTHWTIDHERLFSICESLKGDFLISYDNAEEVQSMADRHVFSTRPVAMKNTHHAKMSELLIGRQLSWVERSS